MLSTNILRIVELYIVRKNVFPIKAHLLNLTNAHVHKKSFNHPKFYYQSIIINLCGWMISNTWQDYYIVDRLIQLIIR